MALASKPLGKVLVITLYMQLIKIHIKKPQRNNVSGYVLINSFAENLNLYFPFNTLVISINMKRRGKIISQYENCKC